MKICLEKVLNLRDGEHFFDFETPGSDLMAGLVDFEGGPIFDGFIHSHVRLQKSGHTYYVKLKIDTRVRQLCDRCLSELHTDLSGSFQMIYSDVKDRADDDSEDWRHFDPRQSNVIVLDKDVHDTLVLALPHKNLCREDCKGLCPDCGANLNKETCSHERERLHPEMVDNNT
jgi:uncharacterized protein